MAERARASSIVWSKLDGYMYIALMRMRVCAYIYSADKNTAERARASCIEW